MSSEQSVLQEAAGSARRLLWQTGQLALVALQGPAVYIGRQYGLERSEIAEHTALREETARLLFDHHYTYHELFVADKVSAADRDGAIRFQQWQHVNTVLIKPTVCPRPPELALSDKDIRKALRQQASFPRAHIVPPLELQSANGGETITLDEDVVPMRSGAVRRIIIKVLKNNGPDRPQPGLMLAKSYTSLNQGPFILADVYDEATLEVLKDEIISRDGFVYVPKGEKAAWLLGKGFVNPDRACFDDLRSPSDHDAERAYYRVPDHFGYERAIQWITYVRSAMEFETQETKRLEGFEATGIPTPVDIATVRGLLAKIRSAESLGTPEMTEYDLSA